MDILLYPEEELTAIVYCAGCVEHNLAQGLREGNRAALAKAITLIETTNPAKKLKANNLVNTLLKDAQKTLKAKGPTCLSLRIGLSGPPGAGKSHFISIVSGKGRWTEQENHTWIREKDEQFEKALSGAAKVAQGAIRKAVGVAITFNDSTNLRPQERDIDPERAVAMRLLHSHFHRGDWRGFVKNISTRTNGIEPVDALHLILSDVDKQFPGEERFVIVAVDEIIKLAGNGLSGREASRACEQALSYFDHIYAHPRVLFVMTSLSAAVLPFTMSGRDIGYFDLPLLDEAAVQYLVKKESPEVQQRLALPVFEKLLFESAGLPRLVWAVFSLARQKDREHMGLQSLRSAALKAALLSDKWHDDQLVDEALQLALAERSFLASSKEKRAAWKKIRAVGYAYPTANDEEGGVIPPAILAHWNLRKLEPKEFLSPVGLIIDNDATLNNQGQGKWFERQFAALWPLLVELFKRCGSRDGMIGRELSIATLLRPWSDVRKDGYAAYQTLRAASSTDPHDDISRSMEGELDPVKVLSKPFKCYMAESPANPGFDLAARVTRDDGSDVLVLFELKRQQQLNMTAIADKLVKVFQCKRPNYIRSNLIPFFNEQRLVFVVGGWTEFHNDVRFRRGNVLDESVVNGCTEYLANAKIPGLEVDEKRIASCLFPLDKSDVRRLFGPSLCRLGTFQQ